MREVSLRSTWREPGPALRGLVRGTWVSAEAEAATATATRREHVLPTGSMHLAVRLGPPLGIVEVGAIAWVGSAVVGGARETHYVKEAVPCVSVGAQLSPFASLALFGVPAHELADRHTPLESLWGAAARSLVDELHASLRCADPAEALLDALDRALLSRFRVLAASGPRDGVRSVLASFDPAVAVAVHAARSGLSHRAFVEHFRAAVGLAPKAYASVLRFQRALDALARPRITHSEIALAAGYADQSHYCRDVARRAGVSPSAYRAAFAGVKNHVVLAG